MFRTAAEEDLAPLAALEMSWSSEPWSERALSEFLENSSSHVLLSECEGKIVAYAAFRLAADYGELLTFAVVPEHRRCGEGRRLLTEVLAFAGQRGVRTFTLEVREGNLAARALYEGLGACVCGRRRGFYTEPKEDALVYTFTGKEVSP